MVKPSKNRDSRRVEQHILGALQDGKSLPKPAIRVLLSLYGQTIVNNTMRQLAMKKVLVETDTGELMLSKDITAVNHNATVRRPPGDDLKRSTEL